MVRSRSRSAIENTDVAAATFVVGDDLQVADFLTLAEAMLNLPSEGGAVFCLTSSSTADTLVMPDKDVTIIWAAGSIWSYTGAGIAIEIPSTLTAVRRFVFCQMTMVCASPLAQTFIQFNATTPPFVWFDYSWILDFKTVNDVQAGDVAYINPVAVYYENSYIRPPGIAGQTLTKSSSAWRSYTFPISIFFTRTDCFFRGDTNPLYQWGGDFDGDWILDTAAIAVKDTRILGLTIIGTTNLTGAFGQTFEVGGAAYYADDAMTGFWLSNGILLKISIQWAKVSGVTLQGGSSILLNDHGIKVEGVADLTTDPGVSTPTTAIDIGASIDDCTISNCKLRWAATQLIKIAKGQRTVIVGCTFLNDSGVKTVVESGLPAPSVGTADYTEITGCSGLGTGTGPTILGAHSRINGSLDRNVVDFGADDTGSADSDAAFARALTAIPGGTKGTVRVPPGSFNLGTPLSIGDVEPNFIFEEGSELTFTGLGANPAFKFTDGLTVVRRPIFNGLKAVGNNVSTDSLFELNDVNSRCLPIIILPRITGFRTAVDIKAGDVDYIDPVYVRFSGGSIISPDSSSRLFKTPNAAGSYTFGSVVELDGTALDTEGVGGNGWTIDFDGDIIGEDLLTIPLGAASAVDGLQLSGTTGIRGAFVLTVNGVNYWSIDTSTITVGNGTTLKVARGTWTIIMDGATIQVNGTYVEVDITQQFNSTSAVAVDVLTGADHARVSGRFKDHATAAIRTDAKYGSFSACRFVSTGAHKTVLETANADFNIATGCTQLNSGGGVTVVGAGSLYDVTLANVA